MCKGTHFIVNKALLTLQVSLFFDLYTHCLHIYIALLWKSESRHANMGTKVVLIILPTVKIEVQHFPALLRSWSVAERTKEGGESREE